MSQPVSPIDPLSEGMPLLLRKLSQPGTRERLVARPHLLERLDAGLGRALTLVCAPAGFGKTTLLASWLSASSRQARTAWVSLDEDDDDPARFLGYLIAAIGSAQPEVGSAALAILRNSPATPVKVIVTRLLNDLSVLASDLVLVLDDYQVISSSTVHDVIWFLLANAPTRLHVIISTRSDPPLPLSRLRARDQLVEIRGADLLFSRDETGSFLNSVMDLDLDPREIATLESRTEGWVAVLQLVGLALQRCRDVPGLIASLGTHPHIVDYLVDEILNHQAGRTRRFLLETSILGELTGPLCDAVTGDCDGADMLGLIERSNLPVSVLDVGRRWYRYHQLFAECLRGHLVAEGPDRIVDLHRRASEWYRGQGSLDEAFGHALSARDLPLAVDIFEEQAPRLLAEGQMAGVLGRAGRLPDSLVRASPRICELIARALVGSGQLDAADSYLRHAADSIEQRAGRPTPPAPDSQIESLRSGIAALRGDVPRTIEHARNALAHLSADDPTERSRAAFQLGNALLFAGDVVEASAACAEAVDAGLAAGSPTRAMVAAAHLAQCELIRGRLDEAERVCERALGFAAHESSKAADYGMASALVHAYLGHIRRERDDLEGSGEHLRQALELAVPSGSFHALAVVYSELALLQMARHDLSTAVESMDRAIGAARDVAPLRRYLSAERIPLLLQAGRIGEAERWEKGVSQADDEALGLVREQELLSLAHLHVARGRSGAALSVLDALLHEAEISGRGGTAIRILTLQALALAETGERGPALEALGRALSLAEPGGYVHAFVDYGAPLGKLLRDIPLGSSTSRYASRLLGAIDPPAKVTGVERTNAGINLPGGVEVLTARELEVLQLVADGASNQRIADRLIVSVGTVKAHVSHIMGKLGVESRTEAAARARRVGLVR